MAKKARHAATGGAADPGAPRTGGGPGGGAAAFSDAKAGKPPLTPRKRSGRWKKWLFGLALAALLLTLGYREYLRLTDMSYFVDTFYEVEDDKLQFPMRIVVLADLHLQEFGEDNADYLIEVESSWEQNYTTLGYIRSSVYDSPSNREMTACEAKKKGWELNEIDDDLRLLRMMVDGTWNEEEFLILKPGERIAADYTGLKLKAVKDE